MIALAKWFPLALTVMAAPAWCQVPGGPVEPPPKNVLYVLVDDASKEDYQTYVTRYGLTPDPDLVPTPTIDALAAAGVTFGYAHTGPRCGTSRAQALRGQSLLQTQYNGFNPPTHYASPPGFETGDYTLPWMLAQRRPDVKVALFGKGFGQNADTCQSGPSQGAVCFSDGDCPAGTCGPDGGTQARGTPALGFHYADTVNFNVNDHTTYSAEVADAPSRSQGGVTFTPYAVSNSFTTREWFSRAETWIDAQTDPWLVMLSLHAPHSPYQDPFNVSDPCDSGTDRGCRAEMLRDVDQRLGLLLAQLDLERTLVIFTADNGDIDKGDTTLGNQVPLIVGYAGVAPGNRGSAHDEVVSHADLAITIADLFGVPRADFEDSYPNWPSVGNGRFAGQPRVIDGRSFRSVLTGYCATILCYATDPPLSFWDQAFAGTFEVLVRGDRYKYYRHTNGDRELYRLPDQSTDLLDPPVDPADQRAFEEMEGEYLTRSATAPNGGLP